MLVPSVVERIDLIVDNAFVVICWRVVTTVPNCEFWVPPAEKKFGILRAQDEKFECELLVSGPALATRYREKTTGG